MKNIIFILMLTLNWGAQNSFATASSCRLYFAPTLNTSKSLGLQIFSREIQNLDEFFKGKTDLSDSELIQILLKDDIRSSFFQLQGLSSIYKSKDSKFFGTLKDYFKNFEDRIGQVALMKSLYEAAVELNEPRLADYFLGRWGIAETSFAEDLRLKKIWGVDQSGFSDLLQKIDSYDKWSDYKKDRSFILKSFIESAEKLQKSIQNNEFVQTDIEKGLHELRRNVRWINIKTRTLAGAAEYVQEKKLPSELNSWFNIFLQENPKLLENRFLNLGPTQVKKPIQLPLKALAMFGEIVYKMGNLKDRAELEIYFAQATQALAFTKDQQKAVMQKVYLKTGQGPTDHVQVSQEYHDQINNSNLFGFLISWLKKNN